MVKEFKKKNSSINFQFVDVEQRRQLIDMFSQTDELLDMFPQTDEVKKRAVQTSQRTWVEPLVLLTRK